MAEVVTIAQGTRMAHADVLLVGDEARVLAGVLREVLEEPRRDRTVALFDNSMTFKIDGHSREQWTVECKPVPLPLPTDSWETFPVYSFELSLTAMEQAIADCERLSRFLSGARAAST